MSTITRTVEIEIDRDGHTALVEVTGYIEPLVRGRFSGPPEDCYPDDGGCAELASATLDGCPLTLTDQEREKAEEALYASWADEEPDYPDPDPDDGYCEEDR